MSSPTPAVESTLGSNRLVLRVCLEALALAALSYGLIHVLTRTELYATAIVLALASIALMSDIVASVRRYARSLQSATHPSHYSPIDRPLAPAAEQIQRTFAQAARPVLEQSLRDQHQITRLQALLDTLSTPLLLLREDGSVEPINRAAHRLGPDVRYLSEISALGQKGAAVIMAMPPGSRRIVAACDGSSLLISVSRLAMAEQATQRLVALQTVATELAAVEVKAWHDMARVLTHEMMNSLTPIASLSESLESLARAALPGDAHHAEEFADALEAIKRRSHGLMQFVERYRALAQLPQPEPQTFSASAWLQGIESLMSADLRQRGVQAAWNAPQPDFELHADRELLEQALINLIHNAAEAAAASATSCVEITLEQHDDAVVLRVRDNGPGLPEAGRDQVFVPFYSTKPHGSGIGLSIARHAALAHDGELTIRDEAPHGCAVELRIAR